MSHLDTAKPLPDTLPYLDSFDTAFLVLTGNVNLVPPQLTIAELVEKARKAKEVIMWGPEATLMGAVLVGAWNKEAKKLMKKLRKQFDTSGDISVDAAKVNKILKQKNFKALGKKAWSGAKEKTLQALATTGEKATKYFDTQREKALSKKVDVEDIVMEEALRDHVGAFVESYPNRILNPEIKKLVKAVETNPAARTIDKLALKERLDKIAALPADYFRGVADVHAGRMWNFTGLQMAHEQGVTEYQVIAVNDRKTCPVCQRMDGRYFQVQQSYDKMMEYLEGGNDPDKLAAIMPFPRVADIDNKSPKELRESGYQPSFHNRCRCDTAFLWADAQPSAKGWEEVSLEERTTRGSKIYGELSEQRMKDFVWRTSKDSQVAILRNAKGEIHTVVQYKKYPKNLRFFGYQKSSVAEGFSFDNMMKDFGRMALDTADQEFIVSSRAVLNATPLKEAGFQYSKKKWGYEFSLKKEKLRKFVEVPKGIPVAKPPVPIVRPVEKPPAPKLPAEGVPPAQPGKYPDVAKRAEAIDALESKERLAERKKILDGLLDDHTGSPSGLKNLELGTRHIQTDELLEMRRRGLRVVVRNEEGRPFFRAERGNGQVVLFKNRRDAITVGHEVGHALDSMYASQTGFSSRMGYWVNGPKLSVRDGNAYRAWFNKNVSDPSKTVKLWGEEVCFKDNWITAYEGRFYGVREGSLGEEWWAVNSERYAKYNQNLDKFDDIVKKLEAKYREKGIPGAALRGEHQAVQDFMNKRLAYEEARESYALNMPKKGGWGGAKKRYPELTKLMEEKVYVRWGGTASPIKPIEVID